MDAIMAVSSFSYNTLRGEKARFAAKLTRTWRILLGVSIAASIVLGVSALVQGLAFGWVAIGVSSVPYMIYQWWSGELKSVPLGKTDKIDQVLASDVLGRLPSHPTPQDIAVAAANVPSGLFFAARYGISVGFLQNITSSVGDSEKVWQLAREVRDKTSSHEISGAVLVVALIRSYSNHENLLASLHLSLGDLYAGVRWYERLQSVINEYKKPKRTGGIARDWSFGYIPLLTRFGQNISDQITRGGLITVDLEAHKSALDQLVDIFGGSQRQNAALVGATGSGKTTLIHAFAARLLDASTNLPASLKFRQVFILNAASLIASAPGRGELESLIMQILSEAYSAKNIIICLDDAQLFFEEGVGSVDLTNVLLPILEAGNLRMILTMDEQRLLKIGQRNPALINALNRIIVAPASKSETFAIMQEQLISIEFRRKVTYMYQALKEAYRLSERYVHDLAMPGRALKLLEAAASYSQQNLVTSKTVQQAIEQTLDIKVGVADDETEREKLLNLETLIHKRMINQVRAVSVVSDALRRARAGVRNPDRPIGTFLFLGPTGVGKTELSKALADVYFGGEERIIRVDLNEYVLPEDVSRLIADGAEDPNSLTAQAMKQPFSVVLLDEIEKAHPNVLATLLQLLDEGILRDVKNREISFKDAIIIATSNAGADRIREYIERGYKLEQFENQFVDELINTNQFRPEFLNRFDEIVTFKPLEKPELLQVVDLILAGVNKTLASQKITVQVDEDAKAYLVEAGYDPRLGARPMRRVVQRAVENTVAKQVLSGAAGAGSMITVTRDQVEQIIGSEQSANQIIGKA